MHQCTPTPHRSSLDHDELRKSTFQQRVDIKSLQNCGGVDGRVFTPSPASQMCSTMTFGFAMFYNGRINFDRLTQAASLLATELPQLAGRVKRSCNNWQESLLSTIPGLRSLGMTSIALSNSGFELVLAENRQLSLDDLGPQQWVTGLYRRSLASFPFPFYAEPLDIQKMLNGEECLFKLKITRCKDGDILSATISHMLCDGGRAIKLLARLSKLYKECKLPDGVPTESPSDLLSFTPSVETAGGYSELIGGKLKEEPGNGPAGEDHHPTDLSLTDWLSVPHALHHHQTKECDVCMLYLPKDSLQKLKTIANDDEVGGLQGSQSPGSMPVSTMDAVQAFIAVLVADLRKKTLVPTAPHELTVNVDLLHRNVVFKDSFKPEQHLGNAVHILQVPGVPAGTTVPGPLDPSEPLHVQIAKLKSAIRQNAKIIREALSRFRSNGNNALRALKYQEEMVSLPELCIAAAFTVKGNRFKVSSTTSVSAFSFDDIDFGWGGPLYTQIYCQPRFDWWTIIQNANQSYGDGVFCTLTLEHGHMQRLEKHPIWRIAGPRARLFLPQAPNVS